MATKPDSKTVSFRENHYDIVVPGDKAATLQYAVQHWVDSAKEAIAEHGAFHVALSGGSTPKAIFEALASGDHGIDWEKVYLYWSDERAVGAEDPDSNFRMAMNAGLGSVGIPADHIHRMDAVGDIGAHADEYEAMILKSVDDGILDLVMLGIGEDGHTASLFPDTRALGERKRLVVANEVPQKECWRMTFTFPLINRAKRIAVYALGGGKAEVLQEIVRSDTDFPACHIGSAEAPATWILDSDAAAQLL